MGVLTASMPRDANDDAEAAHGRQAKRSDGKCPPHVMFYLAMALALYADDDYEQVMAQLTEKQAALRCWDSAWRDPTSVGITQARKRLAARRASPRRTRSATFSLWPTPVAAMVGGAITIEDPQQRILAYSNLPGQPIDDVRREVILGRQVPDRYLHAYRHRYRVQGVVRFGCAPLPRIAAAVRAGADLLGSIWAVGSSGETFGAEAERALPDAAASAALHLLRVRRATDLERRARSELLRCLLTGEPVPRQPACGRVRQRRVRVDGAPADWAPSSPRPRVSRLVMVTT